MVVLAYKHLMPKESASTERTNTLQYAYENEHFLPRLSPDEKDLNVSQSTASLSKQRWRIDCSPKLPSPLAEMVGSHENDKRMDRKAIARRQLMGGLKPSVAQDRNPNRTVRRTQSLSYGHPTNDSLNQSGTWTRASDHSNVTSPSQTQPTRSLKRTSSLRHPTVSDRETRDTIHNWNELVHELNASQHLPHRDSQGHLEVVSDSSETCSTPIPVPVIKPRHPANSSVLSRQSKSKQKTAIFAVHDVFPAGIGFTRYRPITPNLLTSLDRKKQTSRRRTQQWLNQVEVTRRTHVTFPTGNDSSRMVPQSTTREIANYASPQTKSASTRQGAKPVYGFL